MCGHKDDAMFVEQASMDSYLYVLPLSLQTLGANQSCSLESTLTTFLENKAEIEVENFLYPVPTDLVACLAIQRKS